jgi:cbb3-type cytochrome oxidase subunit 3
MLDFVYIAGTIAFFAIMLLYVRFCLSLAGKADAEGSRNDG